MTAALSLATLLAAAALSFPPPVLHLQLESSRPARGDTVTTPLSELHLRFTQKVVAAYTSITLLDAGGVPVAEGAEPADSLLRDWRLAIATPLHRGVYTVRWRTAGADAHVVQGEFAFVVAVDPEEPVAPIAPDPDPIAGDERHDTGSEPDSYQSFAWIATRALTFAAIVMVIGSVVFLAILAHAQTAQPAHTDFWLAATNGTRRLAILAGISVVAIALPRLHLQSAALHGADRAWDTELLESLFQTGWGRAWLLQATAAAVFVVGWGVLRPSRRAGAWFVCLGAALALSLAPALSGHAAAVAGSGVLPVVTDAVHVLGASAWIGSLAFIVLIAIPLAYRRNQHDALAATVRAFSPVALAGAALAAASGVLSAIFHLTDLDQLFTTDYGRMLIIKLAIVAGVVAIGAYNFRRVRLALGEQPASRVLRRSTAIELVLALIVIAVTASLVALPTP